ncbi:MAG: hypothetical protein U0S76_02360 [Pseudoxanthomonas sp.]|nr:hypothetical protein [Pseudoxanthomonas sp.]
MTAPSRRLSMAAPFLALVAVLAGCASAPASRAPADPMAALEQRAGQRWQHLVAGEFAQAYAFLSPGQRSTESEQQYVARMQGQPFKWQRADWRGADCASEEACTVRMGISYSVAMPSAGDVSSITQFNESWIRLGGDWFFVSAEGPRSRPENP